MKAAIAKAETNRLYGEKERAELEERQTPSTFYMGRGENGYNLVKTKKGLQELETVGNIQPSMGMAGRGGLAFDPGTVSRVDEYRRPREAVGPLKVLVRWDINGKTQFWVGGHVKNPILALEIPQNSSPSAFLTNTGRGKDDWILQVRTGFSESATHYTRYGAEPSKSWTRSSGEPLSIYGGGYWFQPVFPSGVPPEPPTLIRQEQTTGGWDDLNEDFNNPDWVWLNDGPFIAYDIRSDFWSGWPAGSRFSGLNSYLDRYESSEDNSLVPALYTDPSNGLQRVTSVVFYREWDRHRQISTQAYTFSEYEGQLYSTSGSYSFNGRVLNIFGYGPFAAIDEYETVTTTISESFSLAYPIAPGVTTSYFSNGSYPGSESAREVFFRLFWMGHSFYSIRNVNGVPWVAGNFDRYNGFNWSAYRETNDFGGAEPQYLDVKAIWRSPDGTEHEVATAPLSDNNPETVDYSSDETTNPQVIGDRLNFYTTKIEPPNASQNDIFSKDVEWILTTKAGRDTSPIRFDKTEKVIKTYAIPLPAGAVNRQVIDKKYFG